MTRGGPRVVSEGNWFILFLSFSSLFLSLSLSSSPLSLTHTSAGLQTSSWVSIKFWGKRNVRKNDFCEVKTVGRTLGKINNKYFTRSATKIDVFGSSPHTIVDEGVGHRAKTMGFVVAWGGDRDEQLCSRQWRTYGGGVRKRRLLREYWPRQRVRFVRFLPLAQFNFSLSTCTHCTRHDCQNLRCFTIIINAPHRTF